MVLFRKNVFFRPNYEVFLAESQKNLKVGKFIKYNEERGFFREKNVFIFSKAFFQKWENTKYAGGSRRSCLFCGLMENSSIDTYFC